MRRNLVLSLSLAVALGTAGCQDQKTEPTSPSGGTDSPSLALGRVTLEKGRIKLPPSARVTDLFTDLASRAVIPTTCNPSTPVTDWFRGEFNEFRFGEPVLFNILFNENLADLIPTFDALFFLTEDTPQFFGYNGEYNKIMAKVERDTKRFWDIFSDDIQLIGMHGTMVLDVDRVAATYQAAFEIAPGVPVPPDLAMFLAEQNRDALLASEVLDGGNHPFFSFNAFAFTDFDGPIPDKIVMGDGILAGYEVVGLGDVAPQGVYGHEFAHHIQFENGYFGDPIPGSASPNQAERTRYTELMADAMSAYYLTHKRGAGMKKQRVEQFLQVFFQIGDCQFGSDGHHGTPLQRMAAARFGFKLADEAQKRGHILPSDVVHDRFVDIYTTLVAP